MPGAEAEEDSLQSLSMERFPAEAGRESRGVAALAASGSAGGDCWRRHEAEICLHRCADMVYVGDISASLFRLGRNGRLLDRIDGENANGRDIYAATRCVSRVGGVRRVVV